LLLIGFELLTVCLHGSDCVIARMGFIRTFYYLFAISQQTVSKW